MQNLKSVIKKYKSSVQIEFLFKGHRCRENIKTAGVEDELQYANKIREEILQEIKDGIFDYPKKFPRSKLAYRVTGEKIPQDFRKNIAPCATCGKMFYPKGKQVQYSRIRNVYCSKECIAWRGYYRLPEWARILLIECRKRASRKGIEFSLDEDNLKKLIFRSGWKCEVSGVQFEFASPTRKGPNRPFSPSIDRINSDIGYTSENCRLVCLVANIAMNTWGESVLIKLATGVIEKQRSIA